MKKYTVLVAVLVLYLSGIGFSGFTPVLTVEAYGGENGDVYGYTNIQLRDLVPGEEWRLTDMFPDGVEIRAENDQTVVLGKLNTADITIIEDPVVSLNFSVTAGDYATAFSFKSPVVTFDPIINPTAYASGSVSVGENDSILGGFYDSSSGDWNIYKTLYNTDGDGAGGTVFQHVTPDTVDPLTEFIGPETIYDTVSSIHIKNSFILSAGGIASGNSAFIVEIPEPATVCLLGLGGLLLRKKRR